MKSLIQKVKTITYISLKKGFNGEVRELFGEFDYPVNKLMYFLYNVAFNTRLFISKFKIKIKKLFYKKQKRY